MGIHRLLGAVAAVSLVAGLVACTPTPVDPVVVEVDDLQGTTVGVPLNSTLIVLTGWSEVTEYTAQIADPTIAEFVEGADTGDAAYAPLLMPLQVGETEVVLSHEADQSSVVFTLEVTPVPAG